MSSDDDADNILKIAAAKKINPELLKVSPAEFKGLAYEEQVHWMIAHFYLRANAFLFENSNQASEETEEESEEEESKEEESEEKEKESKSEEEEEESKVPKTNDDDGGCGPRRASWKRKSEPCEA